MARFSAVAGGHRSGFTLIEALIVMIIAGILLGISVPSFGRLQARRAAINARDSFSLLAARARATAIETGSIVNLVIDPDEESALLTFATSGDTIVFMNYTGDFSADVQIADGALTVCYGPRGFALSGCTSIAAETEVLFERSGEESVALVRPLGQVVNE